LAPTLVLTPELRARLKRPLGKLFRGEPEEVFKRLSRALKGRKVITVGDVVSLNAIRSGLRPWAAIVDGRSMREPLPQHLASQVQAILPRRLRLVNPPGTISENAWGVIGEAVREGEALVLVEGEEDLLTLVAVICAPEGSAVLYGQPGEGVVLVEVNEDTKKAFKELVASMRPAGEAG